MPFNTEVARAGITLGTVLAITISWGRHKSIFLAIVHGFFSWLYVIYYWLTRSKAEQPAATSFLPRPTS